MHPAGVRMRASILAVIAVSIAVIVGTLVLITTLRGSLVDEVDRANLSRADDIATQWFSENELIVLGAGFDNATFAAVFDSTGFYEFTDSSAEIESLLAFIPEFGEAFDGALPLDETIGLIIGARIDYLEIDRQTEDQHTRFEGPSSTLYAGVLLQF